MANVSYFKKKYKMFFTNRHPSAREWYAAAEKNGAKYIIVLHEDWYDAEQKNDKSLVYRKVRIWRERGFRLDLVTDFADKFESSVDYSKGFHILAARKQIIKEVKEWIDLN